jgi:hypothetical protein
MGAQQFAEHALEATPVPQTSYEALGAGAHRSAWGTWFETSGPWAVMNSTFEVGARPAGMPLLLCTPLVLPLLLLASRLAAPGPS